MGRMNAGDVTNNSMLTPARARGDGTVRNVLNVGRVRERTRRVRADYLLALSWATATAATVPAPAASSQRAAGAAPQSMLT